MKVYQITTILVVEDEIEKDEIGELCKEFEETITDNFYISNCVFNYQLKETIDHQDHPGSENDPNGEAFDKWIKKSQEVIEKELNLQEK